MLSFSELWQQAELSDVDVLLTAPPAGDLHAPPQKLAEFPGHIVLLSTSPYFKAQVCLMCSSSSRTELAHMVLTVGRCPTFCASSINLT